MRPRKYIESLPHSKRKKFASLCTEGHCQIPAPPGLEMLERMLQFDPKKRISIDETLKHPYMEELHNPHDEPVREPVEMDDFEFERRKITLEGIREELF